MVRDAWCRNDHKFAIKTSGARKWLKKMNNGRTPIGIENLMLSAEKNSATISIKEE